MTKANASPKIDNEEAECRKKWAAEEHDRIVRQRAVFDIFARDPAYNPLRLAMLRRAYEILVVDMLPAEAADALLEFLPEEDAKKLLDLCFETEDNFDEAMFE